MLKKKITVEEEPPRFGVKALNFYCSLSPHIMWHHDLKYKECPLSEDQRDLPSCGKCMYGKETNNKYNPKKKYKNRRKKNTPKIEKRAKELIPKIGKTFTSK